MSISKLFDDMSAEENIMILQILLDGTHQDSIKTEIEEEIRQLEDQIFEETILLEK